jgi:hypothetical protein
MAKKKQVRIVVLQANLEMRDRDSGFEEGDVEIPLDYALLDAIFDVRLCHGDRPRLIYMSFSIRDLPKGAKTVKLSELLAMRDEHTRELAIQQTKKEIRNSIGY